jgi:hypothetical protein
MNSSMRISTALVVAAALSFAPVAAPAAADDSARSVAVAAAGKLESGYVYPARAHAAAEMLRGNAQSGAYDGLRETALAARVTTDLDAVLHDKHVRLRYSADVLPPANSGGHGPSPEQRADFARAQRESGYGLGRVAHLPGNVGYLDLRGFAGPSEETTTVLDGMANSVAWSNAIVLDLRRNHGGSPEAVARLLSHFLPPKTHVNDFVDRGDGDPPVVRSTYTDEVPGPRITAPLYVLTSGETFSGGEECAYDVQALKRGTLVGAVTGGGANPGGPERVDDHFSIFVPSLRARNPITHQNWEGTGVKPDVAVPRDRALATAYGLALEARLREPSLSAGERAAIGAGRAKLDTMTDAEILAL